MSFLSSTIHLGCGVFEKSLSVEGVSSLRTLSLGSSTIKETLSLKTSHISILNFESAKIHGQTSLDDITSNSIDFDQAHFKGEATFNQIKCLNTFNLGKAVFETRLSLEDGWSRKVSMQTPPILESLHLRKCTLGLSITRTATRLKAYYQENKLSLEEISSIRVGF